MRKATGFKDQGDAKVYLAGASFGWADDLGEAADQLGMMPGCFAVEMCPVPHGHESAHGLVVAARDEWTQQPDAGIVIAVPDARRPDPTTGARPEGRAFPFRPGQAVILDHAHGQRLEGAVFGDYHASNEVRMMGVAALSTGHAASIPWKQNVLLSEHPEGLLVIGGKRFRPESEWLLVARDGVLEKSVGGIWIPDMAKTGACKGTVIQAGSRAWGPDSDEDGFALTFEFGQRIQYIANVAKPREIRDVFSDLPETGRLALIHVGAVLGTLPTEVAPDDYLDRLRRVAESVVV